ncbi:hypothetical protein DFH29DRAFT_995779 [Suillus ampliporus]|nr:hypothetical protein DFH29DRAFT_995779 [Suillus ampliporus]
MSCRFIPTVERGSIDLANVHVGGFMARLAYDSEMKKVCDAWPTLQTTDAEGLASYMMKSFMFHPSTPDSKVSTIIKEVFFTCSETDQFPFISDQGIRHTKDICHFHTEFANFMHTGPVLQEDQHDLLTSMKLPDHLRVVMYTFSDIVKELESRWLSEADMAALLRWWSASWGKDTIPPALIQDLNLNRISDAFGWKEMPIAHWLEHLIDGTPDPAHDIMRVPIFAQCVLGVLSNLWHTLPDEDSHSKVQVILKDVTCIPTTISNIPYMKRPQDAYFPDSNIFRDLPVIRQDLLMDYHMEHVLQYLGVQKRCDMKTVIERATSDDKWNAMDLARYLMSSPQEHVTLVMGMKLFPCSDGERCHITEVFMSTEVNRTLRLPVVKCDSWDSNSQEGTSWTGLTFYVTKL